jgi:lipopolysaccharide export system protein LptA
MRTGSQFLTLNPASGRLVLLTLTCFFLHLSGARAQQPADSSLSDTMRVIEILRADNWRQRTLDSGVVLQILSGNALIRHENTLLEGDSIICDLQSGIAEVFGNIHINDGDSVHTRSQYLRYLGKERKAYLKKKVKLTERKGVIMAEDVVYDLATGMATYSGGGKVLNGKTVLTSNEAVYYSNTKDVYFKRNVRMQDPGYKIDSDSLLYNTELQTATFIAPTRIRTKDGSIIETSSGNYDLKSGEAVFLNKTTYRDSSRSLSGRQIAYQEKSGIIQVEGNGKIVDSANKLIILGNQILINKQSGNFLATRKPVMIFYTDNDSTYIAADTLFSAKKAAERDSTLRDSVDIKQESPDSIRFFKAFQHVRIFNDSLQSVADSLYYNSADSAFRLFGSPVCWNGNSQLSGDSLVLYTENNKARLMEVNDNAIVVNKTAEGLFNQTAGRMIVANFLDGRLDFSRVKGSPAECIYFVQDEDSSYIGMNRSTGDVIDLFFSKDGLQKVKFIQDVNGMLYPMDQIPPEKKQLKNFLWQEDRRPKNKLELFE